MVMTNVRVLEKHGGKIRRPAPSLHRPGRAPGEHWTGCWICGKRLFQCCDIGSLNA
jgi:hypothetical protein